MTQQGSSAENQRQLGDLIRLGRIVSRTGPRCVVEIDEDLLTAPVPWLTLRAGKTRTWSPPDVGEQVLLLSPEGDIEAAIAICGIFSDEFPAPDDADVHLVEFDDGARISYDQAAHALQVLLPADGTITIEAAGGVTITGPVTITGDVAITGNIALDGDADATGTVTAAVDVVGGGKHLKTHTHPSNGSPPS